MDPVYRQLLTELWAPKPTFTVDDSPDQTGRIAVVTGSNVGIGKETCRVLLKKNCKVYMAARSEEKANAAIRELIQDTGKNDIHFLHLDLADLDSVKASAAEFKSKENKLHLLFNNAGVMASPPDMRTKQGYEQHLGVNVVGPFLFTKLLLPVMISTVESAKSDPTLPKDYNIVRIINTASNGHIGAAPGGFNFEDPNKSNSKMGAYYQSKWANIVVANEIAKKYGVKGISAHSVHPGVITSQITRYLSFMDRLVLKPLSYPVHMGPLTQLYAGLMPDAGKPERNGSYLIPFGRYGVTRKDIKEPGVGEKLWNWLEKEVAPYC